MECCATIFSKVSHENRLRLQKKFRQLTPTRMNVATSHTTAETMHNGVEEEQDAGEGEYHGNIPETPAAAAQVVVQDPVRAEVSRHLQPDATQPTTRPSSTTKSTVHNLSNTQLDPALHDLLALGPKFALSRQIDSKVLKEVEAGVERGAFALRWKINIDDRRAQHQPTADHRPPSAMTAATPTSGASETPPAGSPPEADTSQPSGSTQPPSQASLCPRFPDGDCSQAPPGSQSLEKAFEGIKKKVVAAYKNHRSVVPNHSQTQSRALKESSHNLDVVVKPSDNCKGMVLLNTSEYVHKIETITSDYEPIDRNPTPKLEARTKQVIHATFDDKVPPNVVRAVLPQCSRTAELYGLPKDHKPGVPLRPIVSACGDPLDKLSWVLERIITQLLPYVPAHLKNTTQYLETVNTRFPAGFKSGTILFSIDVVNLYGNIPTAEAIDACMTLLNVHSADVNTFGLQLTDIKQLLEHCLNNNFVRFGDKLYRQSSGIAMGSRVAPPLAIVFMHALESMFLGSARHQPSLYLRYIDDVFGVWEHGLEELLEYFNFLNSVHPSIKFTLEHSANTGFIPFLDTKIHISSSGQYSTELFVKPMAAPVIIHFRSAQPMSTKRNTLRSQLIRAVRLSSPGDPRTRSIKTVEKLFLENGYPAHLIKRVRAEVIRSQTRPRHTGSISNRASHGTSPVPLVLPFIDDELCRTIQGIIKSSDVAFRVTWKGGPSVKSKLVRSAHRPVPCPGGGRVCNACTAGLKGSCHSKNVIYRIDCLACEDGESFYIGETRRSVRLRFNEHLRDAKNKREETPFGSHQGHHDVQLNSSNLSLKILHKAKDGPDRKIWESIFIKKLRPTLNTQTSSWPMIS